MKSEIILGIDPGSQVTGFGLIYSTELGEEYIDHGVINIPSTLDLPGKLHFLHGALGQLIKKHQPNHFALENLFLGKNPRSAFILGHVRGVCLQLAYEQKCHINEYEPRKVKKSITGSGASSKEQVQIIVNQLLGLTTLGSLDASDALAIAITHNRHQHIERLHQKVQHL